MKNGIVIYRSRYGATKKYAKWLADRTGFACAELQTVKPEQLQQYDILIFGGGVYASGIAGLSFLRKYYKLFQDKKIAVFCVGASPYDEKAFQKLYDHNFQGALAGVRCFYCRGAWDESGMRFWDRTLCRLLQKSVAKKDPAACEPWESALRSAAGQKCDWTDQTFLEPLLDWLST